MSLKPIAERGPVGPEEFARDIANAYEPIVLRGQVAAWPAVHAGTQGPEAIARYIASFDRGEPVEVMIGAPAIQGRFFYSHDLRGFNFHRERAPLTRLCAELLALIGGGNVPTVYAGAAAAADYLPGWLDANPLPLPTPGAQPRIWIGNSTRVATHYDVSSNIACVIAGLRRFTLFPPDQIVNLYPGPLEHTIAGQPTSMVDLEAPDFARYPKFAEALEAASVAELAPGDAIFIPSLWWHSIASTGPLCVLLNYWWGANDETPAFPVLAHALLSLRDVDPAERAAWRVWFDHYVFSEDSAQAVQHLPEHVRGVLGPPSPQRTQMMKDYLIRALSRST